MRARSDYAVIHARMPRVSRMSDSHTPPVTSLLDGCGCEPERVMWASGDRDAALMRGLLARGVWLGMLTRSTAKACHPTGERPDPVQRDISRKSAKSATFTHARLALLVIGSGDRDGELGTGKRITGNDGLGARAWVESVERAVFMHRLLLRGALWGSARGGLADFGGIDATMRGNDARDGEDARKDYGVRGRELRISL